MTTEQFRRFGPRLGGPDLDDFPLGEPDLLQLLLGLLDFHGDLLPIESYL
ncbi:hypothetical protein ACFWWA_17430 [Streptomyces goshikiensis]